MHRYGTFPLSGLLLSGLLLAGCTPDLNQAEVDEMLLKPSRGLLAGFQPGDSWEKIKADHDKRYTVREETMGLGEHGDQKTTYRQLRRDLGDPGENGFYITFQVDAQGLVTSFSVSIDGRKQNAVTIRKILDDVIAHFDKQIGHGSCGKTPGGQGNSSSCSWGSNDGPHAHVSYNEMSDPIAGSLEISCGGTPKK